MSANCVVVAGRRDGQPKMAACMVLATTRADVNGLVKRELDVRKASFAPMDLAVELTGMEYGGHHARRAAGRLAGVRGQGGSGGAVGRHREWRPAVQARAAGRSARPTAVRPWCASPTSAGNGQGLGSQDTRPTSAA